MRIFFKFLLIVLIIGGGVLIYQKLIHSKPKAKKMHVSLGAPTVKTIMAEPKTETVYVSATGDVIPQNELILVPRVSGGIVQTHHKLIPGEHFKKGELLINIDDRDYKIAVEQSKAAVVKAETDLKMERAKKIIAEREWALLNNEKMKIKGPGTEEAAGWGKDLALRNPQAASFEAALKAAESALEKSRLDLSRTVIRCPFNAILLEKYVTTGRYVTPGTQLLRIAGTDEYWIRATVPVEKLKHIRIPGPGVPEGEGSPVRISLKTGITEGDDQIDGDVFRVGKVLRLEGELETKSRMARLIIAVKDPLMLNTEAKNGEEPLLLGAYVNVSIEADVLSDVYNVPRHAVHEGGKVYLAVFTDNPGKAGNADVLEVKVNPRGNKPGDEKKNGRPDGSYKLKIMTIKEMWRKKHDIQVKGLYPGAKIIVSRIPTPVDGMEIQVLSIER